MAAPPSSAYVLERTITGDDSGIELTSFTTGGELFEPEGAALDPSHPILQEAPLGSRDDFAG